MLFSCKKPKKYGAKRHKNTVYVTLIRINKIKKENSKLKDIRIDIGVCSPLTIDLTEFDFTGITEVIFTIKNTASVNALPVVERRFFSPEVYSEIIRPEESVLLREWAVYDFSFITTDGKRYKATDNGKIILRKAVGVCINE